MHKKILKEALGVPSNLIQTAKEIYGEIYNDIPENIDFDEINEYLTIIKKNFNISDYYFNQVVFSMGIQYSNTLEIVGMSTYDDNKLTKDFKLETKITNTFNLSFRFIGPKKTTGSDIKNYMVKNRPEFIGSIAHELKHKFDFYKKTKTSIPARSKYVTASESGFGDVQSINEFIFYLYYIHVLESLVRPSEIAALIDDGNVTKKEFINFLFNTRTYKTLLNIKNFNYEKFKNDIKSEIPKLKKLYDTNDIEYENLSDDQIVELTLDLIYKNIKNWVRENVNKFLTVNHLEVIFGFSGEKKIFYDNFIKDLNRFGNDYEKFFNYEIKMFHYVSNKMIRKLIKLYDLAK
jgi:hypothetical protein